MNRRDLFKAVATLAAGAVCAPLAKLMPEAPRTFDNTFYVDDETISIPGKIVVRDGKRTTIPLTRAEYQFAWADKHGNILDSADWYAKGTQIVRLEIERDN